MNREREVSHLYRIARTLLAVEAANGCRNGTGVFIDSEDELAVLVDLQKNSVSLKCDSPATRTAYRKPSSRRLLLLPFVSVRSGRIFPVPNPGRGRRPHGRPFVAGLMAKRRPHCHYENQIRATPSSCIMIATEPTSFQRGELWPPDGATGGRNPPTHCPAVSGPAGSQKR